jgi:hypothetical protein
METILRATCHPNAPEADDDHCVTHCGRQWWLGTRRLKSADCLALLRLCLLGHEEEFGGSRYYWRTVEGQRILNDPAYIPLIMRSREEQQAEADLLLVGEE